MNERLFHNDGQPTPCPLVTLFGASNELPEGRELEALFDRFLLRYEVSYLLRPSNLRAVLTAPDPTSPASMSMDQLRAAQAEVQTVTITDETLDALLAIREACKAEGIVASDRRWKKCLKAARASAHLAGETKTSPEDLSLLADCLWREPKERPKLARVVGKLADPIGSQALEILDAARETSVRVSALQTGDRRSYIAAAANALEEFNAQQAKLAELAKSAARRSKQTIADAHLRDPAAAHRARPHRRHRPPHRGRAMKRIIYDVPRWHLLLHREARGLDSASERDAPQEQFEDELFDRLYSGETDLLPVEKRNPALRDWAEKLHAACAQLPAFGRLAQECKGRPAAAATAVEALMSELVSITEPPTTPAQQQRAPLSSASDPPRGESAGLARRATPRRSRLESGRRARALPTVTAPQDGIEDVIDYDQPPA